MIYFIDAKEVGRVKVGYAKRSAIARLAELQITSPVLLTLRWHGPGARHQEVLIQRMLSEHRYIGEWFNDGPHIDAAISFATGLPAAPDATNYDIRMEQKRRAAHSAASTLSTAPTVIEVRCAYCGARPGESCRLVGAKTLRKGFETDHHMVRRRLFSDAMKHRVTDNVAEVPRG